MSGDPSRLGWRSAGISGVLIAASAGACHSPATSWRPEAESLASVSAPPLTVHYPQDAAWGPLLARQVLELLEAGQATSAEVFGLEPEPFASVLTDQPVTSAARFTSITDPATGVPAEVFPLPVGPGDAVLAALDAGDSLTTAEGEVMRSIRHVAIYLHVHEMFHVQFESQIGPTEFHLWLNEGLAEYLAFRTGLACAPQSVPAFLAERLDTLDTMPATGTVDFLRWSPGRGESRFATTGADGTMLKFGWSDPHRLREVAAAVREVRLLLASGMFTGTCAARYEARIRLWEEWLAVARTPRAPGEVAVESADHRTRWGVYGALLSLFLDLVEQGLDLRAFIDSLRQDGGTVAKLVHPGRMTGRGRAELLLTNAAIIDRLSTMTGSDTTGRVRHYPILDARRRLRDAP